MVRGDGLASQESTGLLCMDFKIQDYSAWISRTLQDYTAWISRTLLGYSAWISRTLQALLNLSSFHKSINL